jgi:hypothetical protein
MQEILKIYSLSEPTNLVDDVQEASVHDVFDPNTWENLDTKSRNILIEKGR